MNELQQKLARRRNLNGEGAHAQKSDVGTANGPSTEVQSDSVDAGREIRQNSSSGAPASVPQDSSAGNRKSVRAAPVPQTTSSGGTGIDELQKKLARRRTLNGEALAAATAPDPEPAADTAQILPHAASRTSSIDEAHGEERMSMDRSSGHDQALLAEAALPAAPASAAEDAADPPQEPPVEYDDHADHIDPIPADCVLPAAEPVPAEVLTAVLPCEEQDTPEEPIISSPAAAQVPAELPLVREHGVEEDIPQMAEEVAAVVEPVSECAETDPEPEAEPEPGSELQTVDPEPEPVQQPEVEEQKPIVAGSAAEEVSDDTSIVLQIEEDAVVAEVPVVQDVADSVPAVELVPEEVPAVVVPEPVATSAPVAAPTPGAVSVTPQPVKQPVPTTAAPVIMVPSRSKHDLLAVTSAHPLDRTDSSTDDPSPVTPAKSSKEVSAKSTPARSRSPMPLERSMSERESISGASPALANRWYPGKYLYERRLPWAKAKLQMDSESARNHYQDFISGEGFERLSSSSSASTTSGPIAPLPPAISPATASKSNKQLIEENYQLRQEVSRLQRELDKKQSIIDAHELSFKASVFNPNPANAMPAVAVPAAAPAPVDASPKPKAGSSPRIARGNSRLVKHGLLFEGLDNSLDEEEEEEGGLFDNVETDTKRKGKRISSALTSIQEFDLFNDAPLSPATAEEITTRDSATYLESLLPSDKNLSGSGRSKRYNPLSVGSEKDLVRSFAATKSKVDPEYTASSSGAMAMMAPTTTTGVLFQENGAQVKAAAPPSDADKVSFSSCSCSCADHAQEMSYEEFMTKFAASNDLVNYTRAFLQSVLGPTGDCQPPPKNRKVDYVFYGLHRLDERCKLFFDEMHGKFAAHPSFKGECEERLLWARDQLEQYVMVRFGDHAFQLTINAEEDMQLLKRMQLLSFITPEVRCIPIVPDTCTDPWTGSGHQVRIDERVPAQPGWR